jgi:hypothetical protein
LHRTFKELIEDKSGKILITIFCIGLLKSLIEDKSGKILITIILHDESAQNLIFKVT